MIHWLFTISRVVAIPFCWKFIKMSNPIALYIFCYAVASDFLDGFFARILNQITIFGAIADVVADKLLIYGTTLAVYKSSGKLYLICLMILWLIRDLSLVYLWKDSNITFQSVMMGKVYTCFQFFMAFIILLAHLNKFKIPDSAINISVLVFLFLAIWTINIYSKQFNK